MSRFYDWTLRGTRLAQPAAAASNKGTLYFVTDEGVTERSSGSAWESYSGGGGAPGAGVLVIGASVTPAAPTVLSTVGTVDWWTMINTGTVMNAQPVGYPYRKRFGREFIRNHWIYGGGAGSNFVGGALTGITMTAADNQNRIAQTNFNSYFMIFASGAGVIDYGYGVVVRASKTQRVLHLGSRVWSGVLTVTAHLTDGSVADQTATLTAAPGTGAEFDTPITYKASQEGEELHVEVRLTTNSGSQPHVAQLFGYITP